MDTKGLIDRITEESGISREQVMEMLTGLTEVIGKSCSNLDSIAIPGFGSFEPRVKNERVAIHPSTGKRILVPPKITLSFRPSALLKQKIKKG